MADTIPCFGACEGVPGRKIPPLNLYCTLCLGSGVLPAGGAKAKPRLEPADRPPRMLPRQSMPKPPRRSKRKRRQSALSDAARVARLKAERDRAEWKKNHAPTEKQLEQQRKDLEEWKSQHARR